MAGDELNQGFCVVCKKAGHSILDFHILLKKTVGASLLFISSTWCLIVRELIFWRTSKKRRGKYLFTMHI